MTRREDRLMRRYIRFESIAILALIVAGNLFMLSIAYVIEPRERVAQESPQSAELRACYAEKWKHFSRTRFEQAQGDIGTRQNPHVG